MIDYAALANALSYYSAPQVTNCGFEKIEAPWSISLEAMKVTAPPDAQWYPHQDGNYLVASGEQSFIDLLMKGVLQPGRFCCLTPCFRGEGGNYDILHRQYFMKVELFDNIDTSLTNLMGIISAAAWWFNSAAKIPAKIVKVEPDEWDTTADPKTTYDIVSEEHGIELGSYGIREHKEVGKWVFGTGHAEPRVSYVKALIAPTRRL